jgi:hypothetical protein
MSINRIRSEIKVVFGLTALLPIPALAAFGVLEGLLYNGSLQAADELSIIVVRDFGLFLPLIAALSSAHLMSVEKDEGFDELRHSYPESLSRQSLLRTVIALVQTLMAFCLGWITYSLAFGRMIPPGVLLPVIPATLYLMALSMLVDHLTGSYWAAAGVSLGYWLIEVQIRRISTSPFYLFNAIWPSPGFDPKINLFLLSMAGILLFAVNILIHQKPVRITPANLEPLHDER